MPISMGRSAKRDRIIEEESEDLQGAEFKAPQASSSSSSSSLSLGASLPRNNSNKRRRRRSRSGSRERVPREIIDLRTSPPSSSTSNASGSSTVLQHQQQQQKKNNSAAAAGSRPDSGSVLASSSSSPNSASPSPRARRRTANKDKRREAKRASRADNKFRAQSAWSASDSASGSNSDGGSGSDSSDPGASDSASTAVSWSKTERGRRRRRDDDNDEVVKNPRRKSISSPPLIGDDNDDPTSASLFARAKNFIVDVLSPLQRRLSGGDGGSIPQGPSSLSSSSGSASHSGSTQERRQRLNSDRSSSTAAARRDSRDSTNKPPVHPPPWESRQLSPQSYPDSSRDHYLEVRHRVEERRNYQHRLLAKSQELSKNPFATVISPGRQWSFDFNRLSLASAPPPPLGPRPAGAVRILGSSSAQPVDLTAVGKRRTAEPARVVYDSQTMRFLDRKTYDAKREAQYRENIAKLQASAQELRQAPQAPSKDKSAVAAGVVRSKCRPLTQAEQDKLLPVIRGGPESEILVHGAGPPAFELSRSDFARLSPGEWLNDELVNRYLTLIAEHHAKMHGGQMRVHVFNTFFLGKLEQEQGYRNVQRWTRRVDIFALDKVVVPVHLGNHWCMMIADMKAKAVSYYDSMGGTNPGATRLMLQYLQAEHQDKKHAPLNTSEWKINAPGTRVPQQLNGYDCGVFAVRFAALAVHDLPFEFSQQDLPSFRQRVLHDLLQGELSG